MVRSIYLMIVSLNSAYLDAFHVCAQTGNFTKAATRLHITQSALSQRIKNLEEELGTTLIVRERSGLRLTEAGQELLRYCQNKLLLEEDALARIKTESGDHELSGIIRVGGFSSVMRSVILPSLRDLLKANLRLRVRFVSKELYELKPLMKSGEIDFMILDEEIKQQGMVTKTLGYEKNVQIQKRGYRGPDVFLDHDEDDMTTIRYLKKKSQSAVQRSYLDDIYGIIDGVKMGLGKAIVPAHLISKIPDIEVIDSNKVLSVPVVLHYYEQPFYSKLHEAVVTELARNCSKFLGAL